MYANNLRKFRQEKGLTQFALAVESGVSPQDISKIENGITKPFPSWRRKLAAALGVPEAEIFPGEVEVEQDAGVGR